MKRNIITINEEKCNGCGLCITACHEGALQIIDGKAKLVSDIYCDGLGACLPVCPTGALKVTEREADEFDENEVNKLLSKKETKFAGCSSTKVKVFRKKPTNLSSNNGSSNLKQWPCQIRLIPSNAPFLNNANILIAADCTAFAYANIQNLMKDKTVIIGCPKLDNFDYSKKLTEIVKINNINSITILRMEVPCCGGIVFATQNALNESGKNIKLDVITISIDGEII